MALNYGLVENWSLDEVAVWLNVVNLGQHIKAFERANVTGKTILSIDDQFIQSKLRIHAPAEQLVLRQAIGQLNEQHRSHSLVHKRASDASLNTSGHGVSTMSQSVIGGSNTFQKKRNQTLPPRMPQILPPPPKPLLNKTAKDLLEYKNCKYSGYVKKQGGQHKSWKERFLILSEGCLYYFVNDKATKQKGAFSIAGYRIEDSEPAIKGKHPHSFKMVTDDVNDRVYYFSFVSIHVLQTWKDLIEKEMMELNRVYSIAIHEKLALSPTVANSDDDEAIYTMPPEDDDTDDEEDAYSKIDELDEIVPPANGMPNSANPNVPSFPPRPIHTLPENEQPVAPQPDPNAGSSSGYLTIGEAQTLTLSVPNGHNPVASSSDQYSSDSDPDDPAYIDLLKREDVYPERARFDQLSREEANGKLMEEKYDGMYLIRGSNNVESEKVLSVWTNGKSRHYKVFCDPATQHYSLTSGDSFANISTLLTHYLSNNLPRSEFTLTVPYGYTKMSQQ